MKDFLRDAAYWIVLAIAGKVVTDSLPTIGIKQLWSWFKRFLAGVAYVCSSLWLLLLLLTSTKQQQKAQQQIMLACLVVFVGITLLYLHRTGRLKWEKSEPKGIVS